MAYSFDGGLPFESASKLGHLNVIESEWVQSFIKDFEMQMASMCRRRRIARKDSLQPYQFYLAESIREYFILPNW